MKVHKAFCLFEQSGTWKNEFRKLGIDAEDYDILDDFGETDHVIDLFWEIEKAYSGAPSLFDEIGSDDLAVAFFPKWSGAQQRKGKTEKSEDRLCTHNMRGALSSNLFLTRRRFNCFHLAENTARIARIGERIATRRARHISNIAAIWTTARKSGRIICL